MSVDRGAGTLSAAVGLTVALTMLLGTVQLVARLHRTSVVSAVATDAVHRVAEAPPAAAADARRAAEARIRTILGSEADIHWSAGSEGPAVEVRLPGTGLPGLPADIRRGAYARAERAS